MKKYIMMIAVGVLFSGFVSCGDDSDLPRVNVADRGVVTDDNGNEYEWVRIGDQMWTTSNARNGVPLTEAKYYNGIRNTWVLAEDEDVEYFEDGYFPEFGNLMTLEEAMESAPEGWRLPSDEDWKKLERTLGMKDADNKGFRGDGVAFSMMEKEGGAELGLALGGGCFPKAVYGWIDMSLDYVQENGYYWTSTVDTSYEEEYPMCYYRRVTANFGKVSRECMRADSYLSVRWVKDAD